jgi:hypothetical protein
MPITDRAARYPTWMAAAPASSVPRDRPRHSATPCHSGVTYATGRSQPGSWDSGKNVAENSISGIIPKRNT